MIYQKKTVLSGLTILVVFFAFAFFLQKIEAAVIPILSTQPATDISQYSATLHGTLINTGGEDIYERDFQYGLDTEYGLNEEFFFIDPVELGPYTNNSSLILDCETTYHFRSYARNSAGLGYGGDQEFTTLACPLPPTVITDPATEITLNSAVINARITDIGGEAVSQRGFEFSGTSPNPPFGTISFVSMEYEGQPYGEGPFSLSGDVSNLSNLTCGTTYTYRAYAKGYGIGYGEYVPFDTLDCQIPIVETEDPVLVDEDTAILNGVVIDTGGENPLVGFDYGLDMDYGETIEIGILGAESFSSDLSFLVPEIEYHYRSFAENSAGIGVGGDHGEC